MREIKFRAWDKHIEVMVEPEDIQIDGSGLVSRYYQNCDDGELIWVTDSISLKEIILLQYTGLKDKNGKEIYEGDIVKKSSLDKNGHEVYWHTPTACWRMEGFTGMTRGDMGLMGEVIGNIYENPELIKGEL